MKLIKGRAYYLDDAFHPLSIIYIYLEPRTFEGTYMFRFTSKFGDGYVYKDTNFISRLKEAPITYQVLYGN